MVLREAGFDAETVWDESITGSHDRIISNRTRNESRILVTMDLDFANIHAYPPAQYPGLIVLRLRSQDKPNVIAVVKRVVLALGLRNPNAELWVVEENRIRYRSGG